MNHYYKCLYFLRDVLQGAPLINTVKQGTDQIESSKMDIFPLGYINIISAKTPEACSYFTFDIDVVDIRNVSKVRSTDKFRGNDNEIDNLNTCHAILNYFVTQLQLERNDDDIEVESISDFTPLLVQKTKALDGWRCTVELRIPNNIMVVGCGNE